MEDHGDAVGLGVEDLEGVVDALWSRRRRRGRGSRSAARARAAISIWASKARRCCLGARRSRGSSRSRSRRSPGPSRGRRAARSRAASVVVELGGRGRVAADASRKPPRCARRRRSRPALVSAPRPTLSIRSTPASPRRAEQLVLGRLAEEEVGVGVDHRRGSLGSNSLVARWRDLADYYREIYCGASAARRRRCRSRWPSSSARAAAAMDERGRRTTSSPAPATEETMLANREAFARRRIVPRMLRDVAERDLSTDGARHVDAGAADAGPDRRAEDRPRGGRAGDRPRRRRARACR